MLDSVGTYPAMGHHAIAYNSSSVTLGDEMDDMDIHFAGKKSTMRRARRKDRRRDGMDMDIG